jgi:hypothetical protein
MNWTAMRISEESICPKGGLHRWTDSKEYHDATIEVCQQCSKRMIWRKDEHGRMANRAYLRAHLRSFAQPHGETAKAFAYAYGEEAYRKAVKERPHNLGVNWDLAHDDARKYLRELQKEKSTI